MSISRVHRAALLPLTPSLPRDRVGFIYGAAAKVTALEHWPGPVSRVRANIQTSDKQSTEWKVGAGGWSWQFSGRQLSGVWSRGQHLHGEGRQTNTMELSMLGINNDKLQNTHAKGT